MAQTPKDNRIIPLVLGISLTAGGAVLIIIALCMVWGHMRAASWPEVPARILEAGLYHTRDDGTPRGYSVRAKYAYSYNGKRYVGTEVSFDIGSDNVSSYHHRTYDELRRFSESEQLFRCYVNPSDPSEAVLYRDLRYEKVRWLLSAGLLFSVPGWMLAVFSLRMRKRRKREESAYQCPANPLITGPGQYEGKMIRGASGKKIIIICFSMALIVLLFYYVLIILPPKPKDLESLWIVRLMMYGIPPMFALMLLLGGFSFSLHLAKYGDSVFVMASEFGMIGGELSGTIHTRNIPPGSKIRVTLFCISEKRLTQDQKAELVRWKKTLLTEPASSYHYMRKAEIPVHFSIPDDLPESDMSDPENEIYWNLKAKGGSGWVKYDENFRVPVFRIVELNSPIPAKDI